MKKKWVVLFFILIVSVCCMACKKKSANEEEQKETTITPTPTLKVESEEVVTPTPIPNLPPLDIFLPNLIENPITSSGAALSLDPIVLGPIDYIDQIVENSEQESESEESDQSIFSDNNKAYIDDNQTIVGIRIRNNKITITDVIRVKGNTLEIPATIDNKSVEAIGSFALEDAKVTRVKLAEGIKTIESNAFYGNTTIEAIEIPASVTEIGSNAFGNLPKLNEIGLSPDNTNYCLSNGILYNKDMTSLIRYPSARVDVTCYMKEGVITIEDGAFSMSKKLEFVFFPESLRNIGSEAFAGCILLDVEIPKSIVELGSFAFADCHFMKMIEIPSGINHIAEGVFSGCEKVETVIFNGKIEEIGYAAFSNCTNLNQIQFKQTVNDFGEMSFAYCSSLKTIIIPDGTQEISDMAFYSCNKLEKVFVPSSVTYFGSMVFDESNHVLISTSKGSQAAQYAKSNGIAYKEE